MLIKPKRDIFLPLPAVVYGREIVQLVSLFFLQIQEKLSIFVAHITHRTYEINKEQQQSPRAREKHQACTASPPSEYLTQ